jgi:hypothetical protein
MSRSNGSITLLLIEIARYSTIILMSTYVRGMSNELDPTTALAR